MRSLPLLGLALGLTSLATQGNAVAIVIPEANATYGFVSDESLDSQSFIAEGDALLSALIPLRAQRNFVLVARDWEFILWDDADGQPGSIIASFGQFDPGGQGTVIRGPIGGNFGADFEVFLGEPDAPIPLVRGARYYLGLRPVGGNAPGDAIFTVGDGFCTNTCTGVDLYADGEVWAIRNRPEGWLIVPNGFDFSMTINFVPEASSALLLVVGALAIVIRRSPSMSRSDDQARPPR